MCQKSCLQKQNYLNELSDQEDTLHQCRGSPKSSDTLGRNEVEKRQVCFFWTSMATFSWFSGLDTYTRIVLLLSLDVKLPKQHVLSFLNLHYNMGKSVMINIMYVIFVSHHSHCLCVLQSVLLSSLS